MKNGGRDVDEVQAFVRELTGPVLGSGSIVAAFLYFRKYDRELRDEQRADKAALREERDALRARNQELAEEIERLRGLLWGEHNEED